MVAQVYEDVAIGQRVGILQEAVGNNSWCVQCTASSGTHYLGDGGTLGGESFDYSAVTFGVHTDGTRAEWRVIHAVRDDMHQLVEETCEVAIALKKRR